MYIGNVLLLALNLPLVGVFVQMLRVRGNIMAPIILLVAICGVFSVRNSLFDVATAIVFGIVGYILCKTNFEMGPFILGFILGPILELQFRRTMLVSDGSFSVFLERPLVIAIMMVILAVTAASLVDRLRKRQKRLRELANDPDRTIYV